VKPRAAQNDSSWTALGSFEMGPFFDTMFDEATRRLD
jgi:hypothetical protein